MTDAEALDTIAWCEAQAQNIMAVTARCAATHRDPLAGLEAANRCASDIAINLSMLAQGMQLREDSRSEAEAEGLQPGPAKQDAPK